jgi:hypothetical protein
MHQYFWIALLESLVKDGLGSQPDIFENNREIILNWNPNTHPFLENGDMKYIMDFGFWWECKAVCYRADLFDNSVGPVELGG